MGVTAFRIEYIRIDTVTDNDGMIVTDHLLEPVGRADLLQR